MSKIIRENILKLYNQDNDVVNWDAKLLDRYWLTFDGWLENKSLYDNLCRVTSSERITRARRRLHEAGLIKYSKDADAARMDRFVEDRDDHSEYNAVSWLHD